MSHKVCPLQTADQVCQLRKFIITIFNRKYPNKEKQTITFVYQWFKFKRRIIQFNPFYGLASVGLISSQAYLDISCLTVLGKGHLILFAQKHWTFYHCLNWEIVKETFAYLYFLRLDLKLDCFSSFMQKHFKALFCEICVILLNATLFR